jgi:MazG family protein
MADIKARVLDPSLTPVQQLEVLLEVLRSPEGCSWDRKQTHKSLLPYLIEESYEVVEVIESDDLGGLREELGDLLTQVVFHAQLAKERGEFDLNDAARTVVEKLINRHPHVFGDRQELEPQQVRDQWEKNKTKSGEKKSVLGGLPKTMPALTMAFRMGEKAGGVGFDWKAPADVVAKIDEELAEIREAMALEPARRKERVAEEIGDLLFAVASLARKLEIEPEIALRQALDKFRSRFDALEERVVQDGNHFENYSLEELEAIWQRVKRS